MLTTGESPREGHMVFTVLFFLIIYRLENVQSKKLKNSAL